MITNIALICALVLGSVLFFWLATRAFRLRNPGARWALTVLAALPGVMLVLVVGVVVFGYTTMYLPRSASPIELDFVSTPATIARGEHIARTTCVACHSSNGELPLSGGIDIGTHSPAPIGTIIPPNLTPGWVLKDWSDTEIAQALRNGQHKNGRPLFVMPTALRNLSDDDIVALVAYLRSQPAVKNDTPEPVLTPLVAALVTAGVVEVGAPPVVGSVAAPPKQANAAYGEYVLSYQDCQSCHGPDLNGMPAGLTPATPSVRGALRAWAVEQFIQTMRTGVDPSGHHIQDPMPWQMIGAMDDEELTALYRYLRNEQ